MPKYIDYHGTKVSWSDAFHTDAMASLMKNIILDIRSERVDEFGVKYVNIFLTQDGHGNCISEAPNSEAVLASHAAKGFPLELGEIHPISETLTEITTVKNVRPQG